MTRCSDGRDLVKHLRQCNPRVLRSFIGKFGRRDVEGFNLFITDSESKPFVTVDDVSVFMDSDPAKLPRVYCRFFNMRVARRNFACHDLRFLPDRDLPACRIFCN
jgi:hypothetical protein